MKNELVASALLAPLALIGLIHTIDDPSDGNFLFYSSGEQEEKYLTAG